MRIGNMQRGPPPTVPEVCSGQRMRRRRRTLKDWAAGQEEEYAHSQRQLNWIPVDQLVSVQDDALAVVVHIKYVQGAVSNCITRYYYVLNRLSYRQSEQRTNAGIYPPAIFTALFVSNRTTTNQLEHCDQ